jgi:hypothetical protein
VAAFGDLVVVDEFGVCAFCPASRCGVELVGKTVTPTGISTPLASKKASLLSQYSRPEEIAVLVSQ